MSSVSIRPAAAADLRHVATIERLSFGDPWTARMFSVHLHPGHGDSFVVAEDAVTGAVVGYAVTRVVADESELLNIAVAPDQRGRGIGAMLLDSVIRMCAAMGAVEMLLEVRQSNDAARGLYGTRGFVPVGRRKGYYHSPREDALVLRAELPGADPGNELAPSADAGLLDGSGSSILSPASNQPRQEMI